MDMLNLKLLRDILSNKRQFAGVVIIVAVGVGFFVALLTSYYNLNYSIERPYVELGFADIWMRTSPMDRSEFSRLLSGVDGVADYELRLVVEKPVVVGEDGETISGRIISIPDGDTPSINSILVVEGGFEDGRYVVYVERGFARHHGIRVGDTIYFKNGSGLIGFRVAGIVVSPEYLWPAKSILEHMPDVLRRWGVYFMPESALEELYGLEGLANDVVIKVEDGYDVDEVMIELDRVFSGYGVEEIVSRDEQPSNYIIVLMVESLRSLAIGIPLFFLTISAIATYIVLSRIIQIQTPIIGLLMGLGYSKRRVVIHYFKYSLVTGLVGLGLGIVVGILSSYPITEIFASQISLPIIYSRIYPDVILAGAGFSLAFVCGSGLYTAYRVSRLRPVEAMRYSGINIGSSPGPRFRNLFRGLPNLVRLPFRSMFRRWSRTIYTILGLALSFSMIVIPMAFFDSMDNSINQFFGDVQKYDLKIYFSSPSNTTILNNISSMPGVAIAEPSIEAYVRVDLGGGKETVVVRGVERGSRLVGLNVIEGGGPEGVYLSRAFLFKGGLETGDRIVLDLRPINSMYWRLLNESRDEAYRETLSMLEELYQNLTIYRDYLYMVHQGISEAKDGVAGASKIVYGVPSLYISIWRSIVLDIAGSGNTTIDVYLVNTMALETTLGELVDAFGLEGEGLVYAEQYLSIYAGLWNQSFGDRYIAVDEALMGLESRADTVLDGAIEVLLGYGSLPTDLVNIILLMRTELNLSNWMDEALLNRLAIDLFINVSGYGGDEKLLYMALEEYPGDPDGFIYNVIRNSLAEGGSGGLEENVDRLASLVVYGDGSLEDIALDMVDRYISNYIEANPPPPPEYEVLVAGFVDDPAGLVIYMPIDRLQEIFAMRDMANVVLVELDDLDYIGSVRDAIYDSYEVLYIESSEDVRRDWVDMLELYVGFIGVISLFGAVIASAVTYNTMSINVRERLGEYATMRTLGYSIRELGVMLLIEHGLLVGLAVLLGIPISIVGANYFLGLYNSEFFSFDAIIYPSSYMLGGAILLIVLLITAAISLKTIDKIDLPRIIKELST